MFLLMLPVLIELGADKAKKKLRDEKNPVILQHFQHQVYQLPNKLNRISSASLKIVRLQVRKAAQIEAKSFVW